MEKKILLIDDDIDFTTMNKAVLESRGYTVDTASTAREGLEKVEKFNPDLIILDLMMEHYDSGFTFSHRIKSRPNTKSIPIVMVTSVHRETGLPFDSQTREEREWIKVDEFLEKPISPEDLESTIKKHLG